MDPKQRRVGRAVLAGLVALLVTACDAVVPPSPSPAETEEVVVIPPPTGAQVVSCIGVEAPECAHIADRMVVELPRDQGNPFSIQVRLFRCQDDEAPCPRSLAVRRGQALVEYPDGGIVLVFDLQGPPAEPVIQPVEDLVLTDPIQPGSPRVEDFGPFQFEVGHCGLLHVVDFDGSFWVLQGQVDGEHEALVNAETGSIGLVDPGHARYVGTGNVAFELARFPGAKRFQLCD